MSTDWSEKSNDELIDLLANAGMNMPNGLPEAIIARGESIVEPLCEMLLNERNRDKNATEELAWSRGHAFILLGLIGSAKAAPALLDYFRLELSWEDMVAEDGMQVLGRLDPEAIDPIIGYIGEQERDPILRWVAAGGLVNIGYFHPEERERITDFLKIALGDTNKKNNPELTGGLVSAAACIDDPHLQKQIDLAFERGAVDRTIINEDDVELIRISVAPWADHMPENDLMYYFSESFFTVSKAQIEKRRSLREKKTLADPEPHFFYQGPEPYRRENPKIGRNDPCPCGSGKKYKKCCLDRDEAARRGDDAGIYSEEIDYLDEDFMEDDDLFYDEHEMDEHDKRVAAILGDDNLGVREKSLAKYRNYLKGNLSFPCLLTGIEDFLWEEYYVFGPGDEGKYEELKKTRPSYTDEFELVDIDDEASLDDGLIVQVQRISDRKKFALPLADLEAVNINSKNYLLIDDYVVWFVNSR